MIHSTMLLVSLDGLLEACCIRARKNALISISQ